MKTEQLKTAKEEYKRIFDSPASRFISAMWGGHWHLGLFDSLDEPLLKAQMRANRAMAAPAALAKGKKVLEVACGVGGTARFLAREYGVDVVATNIAESQLAEAREITIAEGLNERIHYEIADFHELGFQDTSFDCWWCQEAFLYAVDKRKVIVEALRVVRPGGTLILSDLTLSRDMVGEERNEFQSAMKTNFSTIEELDELTMEMRLDVVERHDWSRHTIPTFQHLLASLEQIADDYRDTIGSDALDATLFRVRKQLELAQGGQLGWIFYAISRS
jgi:sarcosine/dimethylglycine N-methyltransferase